MSDTPVEFDHVMKEVADGVRLHAVVAGSGPAVVLLHGWPQTWYEWRRVMPGLARTHTVIAVDLKGTGQSSKPVTGYDKVTMAHELDELRGLLGFDRVKVVGHDVGAMVAYAWAATHRDIVTHLGFLDALLPGASLWDGIFADPMAWHLKFHMNRDMPEFLIQGREYGYVEAFFRDRGTNHGAFTDEEIGIYARALAQPGATRGSLEWYRAFPQDADDNRRLAQEPLTIPVLALGGEDRFGPRLVDMLREFAKDVTGGSIPNCGHWVVEERPAAVLAALDTFLAS
jgi:pimeloyl-ACP methyl ester carboxylesterase